MAGEAVRRAEPRIRERLLSAFGSGRPIDLTDCQHAAADAALDLFVSDVDTALYDQVITASEAVSPVTRALTTPRFRESRKVRRLRQLDDALIAELAQRVASRRIRRRDGCPTDVLDLLIEDDGTSEPLDDIEAAQVLATSMTNLHQVLGAALAWLLVATARHAGAERAPVGCAAAIDRQWPAAFVKETLRVYPPIWSTGRRVLRPVQFGGYQVRAGEIVMVSPRLMHADARWWREDPGTFAPQRWLDPSRPPHDKHAYAPYGSGPRFCLGAQIAQAALVQAAELIAARWTVRVTPVEPKPLIDTVIAPEEVRATLTPR